MGKKAFLSCLLASTILLGACTQEEEFIETGQIGVIKGFYGGVSSDEPTVALIGRDVLSAGGTAGDAAVAMAFSMAVTYPGRVSLGGGGVCLVHDGAIGLTETLDFTGQTGSLQTGDRPAAIPGFVRGMAALHARYGTLDWRSLVLPAENLARGAYRISRIAAADLKLAETPLLQDQASSFVFSDGQGKVYPEAVRLNQTDLAVSLSKIRAQGAGAFYQGPFARQIATAIQEAGGNISEEDLRNYLPQWRGLLSVPVNEYAVLFPEPPAGGGSVTAQILGMLVAEDRYLDASAEERIHMLIEASKLAYKAQQGYMTKGWNSNLPNDQLVDMGKLDGMMSGYNPQQASPMTKEMVRFSENPYSASFVVVDRGGNAASCEFSLNNLFGTGRMAPGVGFMVAASPDTRSRNPLNMSPMIVAANINGQFLAAASGSGSSEKKMALVQNYLDVIRDRQLMANTLSKPRVGLAADQKTVTVEAGNDGLKNMLEAKGHLVETTTATSRLNMIYCPFGLPRPRGKEAGNCITATDPRGGGLSLMAVE